MNRIAAHGPGPARQQGKRKGLLAACRSLPAKLLALTAAFMFFGVALIFLPTLASYRRTWLKDRVGMAEVASLAVKAAPGNRLSRSLENELLKSAGVLVVAIRTHGMRQMVLQSRRPPMAEVRYDLRDERWWRSLLATLQTLLAGGERVVLVIDRPPTIDAEFIELAMNERPLYRALMKQSAFILRYAFLLALLAGAVLYGVLHVLLIRPVRRLGTAMARFGANPEEAPPPARPARSDEIGALEQAFADMRLQIATLLQEKSRLAAVGAAVSRIAHELRNMLTAAHMISDRLSTVRDPVVERLSPKLLQSVDRAIEFCSATLKYGRLREPPPQRRMLPLRELVADVFAALPREDTVVLRNRVPPDLLVDADPDQLFRALYNLVRNACQALLELPEGRRRQVIIEARREREGTAITIADSGPGLPEKVRAHLFEPFVGASAHRGGAGLGLAITHEIVRAHRGEIRLVKSDETGTVFCLHVPDRLRAVSGDESADGMARERWRHS